MSRRRSAPPEVDHLDLYYRVFGSVTSDQSNERIEVEISARPGDQVAEVCIRVPSSLVAGLGLGRVLTLSTGRVGNLARRAVEITGLDASGGYEFAHARADGEIEFALVNKGTSDAPLTVRFLAWEAVGPLEGPPPYVHATLDVCLSFPGLADRPALLTIIIPDSNTPRSTQGNYTLSYPSRTHAGLRKTNFYFSSAGKVQIRYRFGPTDAISSPWVSLGRAAVSAGFIFFVCDLARSVDRADRFLALIASFAAGATVLWDVFHEATRFDIYARNRRSLQFGVLVVQIAVLGILILALAALSGSANGTLLSIATWSSGIAAVLLGLGAALGFYLHFQGYWHGFRCDHMDCQRLLKRRRGRPECRFTGRVMCDEHIQEVCTTCPHGDDLMSGEMKSLSSYSPVFLACRDGLKSTDHQVAPSGDGHGD